MRLVLFTSIAVLAVVLFAPARAVPQPQPPQLAGWVAAGGPDPRVASPAEVARWFAERPTAAGLAAEFPDLAGNLDGAPIPLRLAIHGGGVLQRDRRGDGRIVAVVGDLATADRIAVVVPGVDTTQWTFHSGLGGVRRRSPLWQARQVYAAAGSDRVAVVAWLGYDPPEGVRAAAVRTDRALAGALALQRFVDGLVAVRPGASIVLIGHSYGALVVGLAAGGLDPAVTDLVALGSTGMGVRRAADLHTTARVWAGTAPDDWTRWVPGVRIGGAGHGTRPTSDGFGALRVPTADVSGHDGYFAPGTRSLAALGTIVASGSPVASVSPVRVVPSGPAGSPVPGRPGRRRWRPGSAGCERPDP